jgi:two-component system, NarL family, invasion response regulator UvrY
MAMLNILIADDHSVVRSGLRILIEMDHLAKIDEASKGDETEKLIKKNVYDLIILDINMPDTNSTRLIEFTRKRSPNTKILIFSMNPEKIYARRYLSMGVNGYLNKESTDRETRKAIRDVLNGKLSVSEKMTEELKKNAILGKKENPFDQLSLREFEVVSLFIQGKGVHEINRLLHIHPSTIGNHKSSIFEKLRVNSVIELYELAKLYGIS